MNDPRRPEGEPQGEAVGRRPQDEQPQDDVHVHGQGEFEDEDEEIGDAISLEALSAAYAQLMEGAPTAAVPARPDSIPQTDSDVAPSVLDTAAQEDAPEVVGDITPQSILEAMLFVGSPDNQPLTSAQVAGLLRGVADEEVDELVAALNRVYDQQQRPYRIESVGAGYALQLRPEYADLRDNFYGRVREARLSQAAIDVLAIVAYQQPVTREDVERIRGRPSGGVLNQMVRRQLLRIERGDRKPRQPKYLTTDRFLELFGLESLSELPESHDLDRDF